MIVPIVAAIPEPVIIALPLVSTGSMELTTYVTPGTKEGDEKMKAAKAAGRPRKPFPFLYEKATLKGVWENGLPDKETECF